MTTTAVVTPADIGELKNRLKAGWSAGDYGVIAESLQTSAATFVSRIPIEKGSRVLDVACGTGQVAFPAFRAGARVTGIDIVPDLIAQARRRATRENCAIRFEVGDAEALPYPDNRFDLVVSLIGAMFAPRPERAAAELVRVCRPGGRIVMGNWTPEGFIGQMFRIVARYVPPSPLMEPPVRWGQEDVVRERFKDGIADLKLARRAYRFHYPFAPQGVVDYYREYFGPINLAFATLDAEGAKDLRRELERLWARYNQASNGDTTVDAELLEVVAVCR